MAYLVKGDQATRFKLPESISREIVSFDRGAGFQVGEYHLEKPPKSMKLGHREPRVEPEDRNRGNGEPKRRHVTNNVRSVLGGKKPADE